MVAPIGQILALADEDEVEVAVVVVVAPVCCTLGNCGEAEDVEVAAIGFVERGLAVFNAVLAGQQQVEIAVIVVVAPVDIAIAQGRQPGVGLDCERATLIDVEQALSIAAAVLAKDGEVEVAIAIVVAPVHGCLFERADALVRGHELLNIEDLLLRPVRACEAAVDRLHAPEIGVGRQAAAQDLVGFEAAVTWSDHRGAAVDLAAAGLGADAEVVGQLGALSIGTRCPAEEDAAAGDGGWIESGGGGGGGVGQGGTLVVVENGAALAALVGA